MNVPKLMVLHVITLYFRNNRALSALERIWVPLTHLYLPSQLMNERFLILNSCRE